MLGETVYSAIVLGSVYALLAAGFVVIYRSSRILNFAYGDIVLLASYSLVTMTTLRTTPTAIGIVITLLASFFVGAGTYALLISPMAGQPVFSIVILTVCVGIVIRTVTILVWSGEGAIISLGVGCDYYSISNVNISSKEIVLIMATVLVFMGLIIFYRYSKIGQQMRATAESALLASQRGINIHLIAGIAWGLGFFLSALGALFLGANYGVSLHMGHTAIKAFAVALVGGLDSVRGIIPAAFIISLSELIACTYVNPRLGDTMPFIIMLAILILRPWGLFGTKEEIERI
jgi:branched-chain amino acid transport system permease protein